MERHVDTWEGNGGESTFQLDVSFLFLLLLRLLEARLDDVTEHFLDFLNRVGFSQLGVVKSVIS